MTTSTPTLTAGDIAHYIRRSDEPLGAAIARFRNWEKTGIIKSLGDRHPGTGRKKRYSGAALIESVLLQKIITSIGSPAVSLKPLLDRVSEMTRKGLLAGQHDWLVLSGGVSGMTIGQTDKTSLQRYLSGMSDNAVHVVIDVGSVVKSLPYDLLADYLTPSALEALKKKSSGYTAIRTTDDGDFESRNCDGRRFGNHQKKRWEPRDD
jgi:hypothetical protein